jgi:hypothetical protein
MAEFSLPSSLDFSKKLPELPDNASATLMSIQSTNGISFSPGQVIQFDLPARSGLFIDGKSCFIRYKVSYTATGGTAQIKRKPVYTNFARLDEFVGSVPTNSVYQYNQVANMWVDTNFNVADVYGQQSSWGLNQSLGIGDIDGVAVAAGTTDLYVAAPLVCSFLTGADKLIPTGLMAPIRIQLTVDSLSNIAGGVAATVAFLTGMTISQPELCFQTLELGGQVEAMIASVSPRLYIKTQGWANASQSLASGTSGFNTLVFNHRYNSIENLYFLSSSNVVTKCLNTWGDSVNPLGTAGTNGSIQLQIAQTVVPSLPINNATGGLGAVQQYLRECVGIITDQRNTMSILKGNSDYVAGDATATTVDIPAKFIVGFPLARVNQTSPYQQIALMSGISAASTPINVLLNVGTAFNSAMNFFLIAQYTELLEIDVMTRQVNVVC